MQVKREARGSPLNRPSSLETIFRDNFYNAKHRVKRSEVRLEPRKGHEGVRCGWYDFGSKVVAWGLTEILPGGSGPMHRQLCESTMFVLEGQGYTLVNGRRFEWQKGDILFIPLFAWHQHFNSGSEIVRYVRMSTAPLFRHLGIYREENLLPPPSWERADQETGSLGRVLIRKEEWLTKAHWEKSKEGETISFDFNYRVPTTAKVPSRGQPGEKGGMHRHASEAQIFIYQGKGYSTLNDVRIDWEEGDVVRVPLFAWHQHTNTGNIPAIWLKNTSAGLYNQLSMLLRDEKVDFKGEVSIFKDDFKPF